MLRTLEKNRPFQRKRKNPICDSPRSNQVPKYIKYQKLLLTCASISERPYTYHNTARGDKKQLPSLGDSLVNTGPDKGTHIDRYILWINC